MLNVADIKELPSALADAIGLIMKVAAGSTSQFFAFTVILGGFFLFLLVVNPLPGFFHVGFGVTKILGMRVKYVGLSVLVCIGLFCTLGLMKESWNYYSDFGKGDYCKDLATDQQVQRCMGSRFRRERNMYMHFLGAVIYFSLHKIAPLVEWNGKAKRD